MTNMNSVIKEQQSLLIYVILGLVIGTGLDGLFYQKITLIFPYLWISTFALFFALAFDFRHPIRIFVSSALVTALSCSPFLLIGPDSSKIDNTNLGLSVVFFPYALMIAHSFHFAFHLDNKIKVRYTSLFYAVWNTIPMLIIASMFSFIAKLLIWLTAAIFAAFHFKSISEFLFTNNHFWIISSVCLFITGIGIARQNLTILDSLRFVILKLFYYLYPFLALISLLYLVLFTYTALLGNIPDSSTVIFIALSILGIIFFNAIFQDGEAQNYQSKGLRIFLRSYRLMLFLITVLAAHRLLPDAKQFINAVLLLIILVLYGLSYGISAFMEGPLSNQTIKSANIIISLLYIISYLIINNPIMPIGSNAPETIIRKLDQQSRSYIQYLPELKKQLKQQDTKLKQLDLTWRPPSENLVPLENLCRTHIKPYGWITGQIIKNQCQVIHASRVLKKSHYQILTGNPAILFWGPADDTIPLPLGSELVNIDKVKPQAICRTKLNNQVNIGSLFTNYCIVPENGRASYLYSQFEILTINAQDYPDQMSLFLDEDIEATGLKFVSPPTNDMFVIGINTKGNIGICRGAYLKGLQIGFYQDNQCIVSYGGKSILLTNYSVLTSITKTPNVTWSPPQYRAVMRSDHNLILGYEQVKGGTVRMLEACRGIFDNSIYIGKIVDSQCKISVGDEEQVLKTGNFTSLKPIPNH